MKKKPTTFEEAGEIIAFKHISGGKEFDEIIVVDKEPCKHEKTYRFMGGKLVCTDCGKVLSNGNIRV